MTSPAPLAIQLYTLREQLQTDLRGVLERLAEIGFRGVEPFGLDVPRARETAHLCQALGLAIPAFHGSLPIGDDQVATLEIAAALGATYMVCPSQPREEYESEAGVRGIIERLNAASAVCQANGLTLAYHNHWWEFAVLPETGRPAYDLLLSGLDPAVVLEIDTYWVKTGGHDPAALIQSLGKRAPLLHIKDGPADAPASPMVAAGQGVMDIPAIMAASGGNAAWAILEMDRCATDVMEAVAQSYTYLTGEGLARGR